MTDIAAIFAANLKRLRAEQGLSYRALAGKCGLTHSLLHRAEHGKGTDLVNAGRIAQGLGVTLTSMLERPEPPSCPRCRDAPPPGYACLSCGTEGEAQP